MIELINQCCGNCHWWTHYGHDEYGLCHWSLGKRVPQWILEQVDTDRNETRDDCGELCGAHRFKVTEELDPPETERIQGPPVYGQTGVKV